MELNRNYGAMTTAREFWGGNNGFITVAVQMPDADTLLPVGTAFDAAFKDVNEWKAGGSLDVDAADQILVSNAERNLFRIAQAIGQRAVVVAVSPLERVEATDKIDDLVITVGDNVLAGAKDGTSATVATNTKPIFYVTFLIERADVFTKMDDKPGTNGHGVYSVDALAELVSNISHAGFFENNTYTQSPAGNKLTGGRSTAIAVAAKVFDALPVLK